MTIIAAADGSALGNPGPAGWAWYVDDDCWRSGGWPHGTNNMGELTAVLDLLQQTASSDESLLIYCDSTYVINTVTKWMAGWKRKGWRKGDGKPVLNLEIIQALDQAMQGRDVTFEWVKGHSGHELNEQADQLANAAALAHKEGKGADRGPGFGEATSAHPAPSKAAEQLDLFAELTDSVASDEETVIALERSLLTDAVRQDPAAVAELLHPEWQEIGRSGRLWERSEQLAEIGPLPEETSLDVIGVHRIAPGTILLVWRALGRSTSLWSSLWVQEPDGRWRARFHQGTPESGQ